MLNKAICFFSLQLIASPLLAGSFGPADIQAAVPLCQTLDEVGCNSNEQQPVYIKAPETGLHAWLHNPIESLVEPIVIPTVARNIVSQPVESENDEPQMIELGYISPEEHRIRCAKIHAEKAVLDNEDRYAVNYDGNQLIYFGFSLKNTIQEQPSRHASLPLKQMGHYLLTSAEPGFPQRLKALNDIKSCILDHVMVNHETLVEANHFSMKNNHIILDNKS